MVIKNPVMLKIFLKQYKKEARKQGVDELAVYPNFCKLVEEKKITVVGLSKPEVYDMAMDEFLGGKQ